MRWLLVLLALGTLGAGCTAQAPQPEPFGEFSVTRSGGVAGVQELLRVDPGGTAFATSPELRAGRLSADRLAHARRLLESPELAREARAARSDDDDGCVDTFVSTVRMGALSMSVAGTCRTGGRRATPTFDELLDVVGEARRGTFDEPLAAGDVLALTVRVEQPAARSTTPYVVVLAPSGRATRTRPGTAAEHVDLPAAERDAVALAAAGLLAASPTPCTAVGYPDVEITAPEGRRVNGSGCGFGARGVDASALARTLGRAFDRG